MRFEMVLMRACMPLCASMRVRLSVCACVCVRPCACVSLPGEEPELGTEAGFGLDEGHLWQDLHVLSHLWAHLERHAQSGVRTARDRKNNSIYLSVSISHQLVGELTLSCNPSLPRLAPPPLRLVFPEA